MADNNQNENGSPDPVPMKHGIVLTPKALIIIIISIVIVLGAIGGGIFMIMNKDKDDSATFVDAQGNPVEKFVPEIDKSVLLDVTPEDLDRIKQNQQKKADDAAITIAITPTPTFPDGKSEGIVKISNSKVNLNSVVVEYILDADNKVVLTTGLIPPGSMIENKALDVDLAKGEYPATAMFTAYDDNNNEVGKVGMAITIKVLA